MLVLILYAKEFLLLMCEQKLISCRKHSHETIFWVNLIWIFKQICWIYWHTSAFSILFYSIFYSSSKRSSYWKLTPQFFSIMRFSQELIISFPLIGIKHIKRICIAIIGDFLNKKIGKYYQKYCRENDKGVMARITALSHQIQTQTYWSEAWLGRYI